MSLWLEILAQGRRLFEADPVDASLDPAGDCAPDPNDVGFTAAIVGLGAKLAAADGFVSNNEVAAFSRVFRSRPEDAASVQRVFNLARQTVNGYEAYARRIGRKYKGRPCLLEGVLDGLFQIALADGVVKVEELAYLKSVSDAFGFSEATFRRIKASYLGSSPDDPYHVLGVSYDAEFAEVRKAYRRLMSDNHPDRVVTNGAPPEFEAAAQRKAAAITSAYARIKAERGQILS
ncbi:MAG: TerB family tellurite resistance protein [Pseudomonadota bacterium]